MSTRIDISVAADLLRRLNRSQSQANRQGLQERERRDRLTQQGTTLRQQQNAAAGLNFDGSIYRRRPVRPRFLEEPAATPLLTAPGFVLVPHAAYEPQGIPTLVRRLDPLWFQSFGAAPAINLAGGPLETGALISTGLGAAIATTATPLANIIGKPHTLEALVNLRTVTLGTQYAPASYVDFTYVAGDGAGSTAGVTIWWILYEPYGGAGFAVSEIRFFGLVADIYIISVEPTWQYQANYVVRPEIHSPDTWRHLAYVSSGYTAGQPMTETLYYNGVKLFTASGLPPVLGSGLLSAPTDWSTGNRYDGDGPPPRVHGLRYTQKALYTGESFTPPTTITAPA